MVSWKDWEMSEVMEFTDDVCEGARWASDGELEDRIEKIKRVEELYQISGGVPQAAICRGALRFLEKMLERDQSERSI